MGKFEDDINAANEHVRKATGAAADGLPRGLRVIGGGKKEEGEDEQPPKAPMIELPGLLSEFGKEVGNVLSEKDIFLRGDTLVVLIEQRRRGRLRNELLLVGPQRFRSEIERWIVPYRWKGTGKGAEEIPCSMPKDVADQLLNNGEFLGRVRRIERLNHVRQPIMREDGRVELLKVGYDEESGTLTMPGPVDVREDMSKKEAVATIRDRYDEFPYMDLRSFAVHVAMMVSIFAPQLLRPGTPRMGGIYKSNSPVSGKSLLATSACTPAYGEPGAAPSDNRNELETFLDAVALENQPFVFFDNKDGYFKSEALERFISQASRTGRLYHTQRTFTAEKDTSVLITGNDLQVTRAQGRRMLACVLRMEEFDVKERPQFRRVLTNEFLCRPQERSLMCSALWALIRSWYEDGCPKAGPDQQRPMRVEGFEVWSDVFGGIVQAAGFGNPLEPVPDSAGVVPETQQTKTLVELMAAKLEMGSKRAEWRFTEIAELCWDNDLLTWKMPKCKVAESTDGAGNTTSSLLISPEAHSALAKYLIGAAVCDRTFKLKDGRTVRFGYTGANRTRRYFVELKGQAKAGSTTGKLPDLAT
jgi:hypothetical protein